MMRLLTMAVLSLFGVQMASCQQAAKPAPEPVNAVAFANLARFADANAALPPPAPGVERVVFMGDSLTANWQGHFDRDFPGKPYIGRGIGGQTTSQMLLRFMPDVIRLKPAVVLLLAGSNDIAENTGPETDQQIEDNIVAMVMMARGAHIRVVLSSILPMSKIPWHAGIEPAARVQRLNTWIAQYAAAQHLVYCDYYTAMAQPDGGMKPELAVDKFVHPNAAGYAVMAPIAERAIHQALASPAP